MNGDGETGWTGARKGGRPRLPDSVRLDRPRRIRFSDDDLDHISEGLRALYYNSGERVSFADFVRRACMAEASRQIQEAKR